MMAKTALKNIIQALQTEDITAELVEDGALIQYDNTRVALFVETDLNGGFIVRLHLDLDLYVEQESLADILMGMNLLNQGLDYGALNLDPVDVTSHDRDLEDRNLETGETSLTFTVLGRSVLWLTELSQSELARLREHLIRFINEITEAVEQTLHGNKGMRA